MTHGHAHEEAEHASHHAHDPFDKRVAMSMVVIAAVLAAVKVLGHRTHNETLAYQIKSGVAHTQESDQWNFFQSKKMREVLARLEADLLLQEATRGRDGKSASANSESRIDWDKRIDKLVKDFAEVITPPKVDTKTDPPEKAAKGLVEAMKKRYEGLLKEGLLPEQARRIVFSEEASRRYNQESRYIAEKATRLKQEADAYQKQSAHKHHQADYFDLGELGVELALVLASVAILSKRATYWYAGIALGLVGLVAVGLGFVVH